MISLKTIFVAAAALAMVACSVDKSPELQAADVKATKAVHNIDGLLKTCASCHGNKGVSTASNWPNLAGQKAGYLALQLHAFKNGSRTEPLMAAQAKNLSDQDIKALADYYSKQVDARVASVEPNPAGAHVRARCVSCHGRKGKTVNRTWPNLAGQQKEYLAKQLKDYQSGQRKHPIMEVIAGELSEQQMIDVAEYYSAIPAQ
jgi:cytochrome c553